jgi:hypothetical protein
MPQFTVFIRRSNGHNMPNPIDRQVLTTITNLPEKTGKRLKAGGFESGM